MENKKCKCIDFTEFPILKDTIFPECRPPKNKFLMMCNNFLLIVKN